MNQVHLRPVTAENSAECIALELEEHQKTWVWHNAKSIEEAATDPKLFCLAIYTADALGWPKPRSPMVGFTMVELSAGVGFICRLMIDRRHQRMGYGRAAMVALIRRLRLNPDVELIATSYHRQNEPAAKLYRSLGFVDWDIEWAKTQSDHSEVSPLLNEGRRFPVASSRLVKKIL